MPDGLRVCVRQRTDPVIADRAACAMPRCQILRRAAHIVGDRHALRLMLKVPMNDLYDWLAGYARPPTHVFLQAVDIIDAHADRQARGSSGASA